MPSRARWYIGKVVTSKPSSSTLPLSALIKPVIM